MLPIDRASAPVGSAETARGVRPARWRADPIGRGCAPAFRGRALRFGARLLARGPRFRRLIGHVRFVPPCGEAALLYHFGGLRAQPYEPGAGLIASPPRFRIDLVGGPMGLVLRGFGGWRRLVASASRRRRSRRRSPQLCLGQRLAGRVAWPARRRRAAPRGRGQQLAQAGSCAPNRPARPAAAGSSCRGWDGDQRCPTPPRAHSDRPAAGRPHAAARPRSR